MSEKREIFATLLASMFGLKMTKEQKKIYLIHTLLSMIISAISVFLIIFIAKAAGGMEIILSWWIFSHMRHIWQSQQ
ncbi:MAG: hypothetical protein LBF71_05885 [Campylobacteraceae bacterium]|jgi:hypothetical protein|nr:hypothetical protein [Campylobacteraceae bacterium]